MDSRRNSIQTSRSDQATAPSSNKAPIGPLLLARAQFIPAAGHRLQNRHLASEKRRIYGVANTRTPTHLNSRTGGSRLAEVHQVQKASRLIQIRNAPTLSQRLSIAPNPMRPFANTFVMDVMLGRY